MKRAAPTVVFYSRNNNSGKLSTSVSGADEGNNGQITWRSKWIHMHREMLAHMQQVKGLHTGYSRCRTLGVNYAYRKSKIFTVKWAEYSNFSHYRWIVFICTNRPTNRHYAAILEWVADGNTIAAAD